MAWKAGWAKSWIGNWDTNFIKSDGDIISMSGLQVWYKTDRAQYLTLAGTAITQFLDQSGNGNHTTVQATSTKRMTWTANQLNGMPVAVADAGDSYAMPSTLYSIFNGNYTVFCVSKANSATLQYRLYTASEAGGTKAFMNYAVTNSTATFGARNTFDGVESAVFTKTNAAIITAFRNGTTESISINNGTATSDTSAVNSAAIDALRFCSAADESLALDGYIAEFLIYNRVLSAQEIILVNKILSRKWGIAIA